MYYLTFLSGANVYVRLSVSFTALHLLRWGRVSHLDPELASLASLASQLDPKIPYIFPSDRIVCRLPDRLGIYVDLRIQTQVLTLARQVPPLSYFLNFPHTLPKIQLLPNTNWGSVNSNIDLHCPDLPLTVAQLWNTGLTGTSTLKAVEFSSPSFSSLSTDFMTHLQLVQPPVDWQEAFVHLSQTFCCHKEHYFEKLPPFFIFLVIFLFRISYLNLYLWLFNLLNQH